MLPRREAAVTRDLQHDNINPTARRSFIIRHGILRYGLILGLLVFGWIAAGEYGTELQHLRTQAGWLKLLILLLLSIGEWTIGAGWLFGSLLWFIRGHPGASNRIPTGRRR